MDAHARVFGEIDRERMLDMDRRVAPVRRKALAVLGIALLLSAPWLGWWTLAPLVLAVGLFQIADRQARRVAHRADLRESEEVAETLRAAVDAEHPKDGWPVTMSFGVSASARGELFRYHHLFAAADAALYEAKRLGRDQVRAADSDEHANGHRSQPELVGAATGR